MTSDMADSGITSEGVRAAKFREKLKGYHPADVDGFLEDVAATLDALHGAIREVAERADRAEAALSASGDASESVTKTLVLAQRTAEMAISEAQEEAARIRAEAAQVGEQTDRARAEGIAAAEAAAAELRAQSEREYAAATEQAAMAIAQAEAKAEMTLAAAVERARITEEEATTRFAAAEQRATASAERHRADAVRAAEDGVRALADQHQQLLIDIGVLAHYLGAERARVLDVLTSAVEHLGRSLTPVVPPGAAEIERVLDQVRQASEAIDPATEDSWSFDPTVLKQPENQWWSSNPPGGTQTADSSPWPSAATAALPETELVDSQTSAETVSDAQSAGPETSGPETSGPETSGPGPVDSVSTGAPAPREGGQSPWSATPWSAPPERAVPHEGGAMAIPSADGVSDGATGGEDAAGSTPTDSGQVGDPQHGTPDAEEDPPARLLFTLEDDARRPDLDPASAEARSRKHLGRRRV
ncbi:MAG: hypothetical protein NVS3B12_00330 [Acidimicrobiales bacterium]